MKTTLLIMAAGIGSRFGTGIKQLKPVDDAGHIIMDYSIHDALEAGFNHVIFIIRKDIEQANHAIGLAWRPYGGKRSGTDWTGDRLRNLHILYSDSNPDGFHDFYYATKSRGIGYTY